MPQTRENPTMSYDDARSLLMKAPLPPDQKRGSLVLDTFEISKDAAKMYNLQLAFGGIESYARRVEPGKYRRLSVDRTLWMSTTPAEVRDHIDPVRRAHGRVLITGLGLGLVASAICTKRDVAHVTVIEKHPLVVETVGRWIEKRYGSKITVIEADALEWKPSKGERWTVAWHDIWPAICSDNLASMGKLGRKLSRRIDEWQGFWGKRECQRQARAGRSSFGY